MVSGQEKNVIKSYFGYSKFLFSTVSGHKKMLLRVTLTTPFQEISIFLKDQFLYSNGNPLKNVFVKLAIEGNVKT